jgi:hypothetical protein
VIDIPTYVTEKFALMTDRVGCIINMNAHEVTNYHRTLTYQAIIAEIVAELTLAGEKVDNIAKVLVAFSTTMCGLDTTVAVDAVTSIKISPYTQLIRAVEGVCAHETAWIGLLTRYTQNLPFDVAPTPENPAGYYDLSYAKHELVAMKRDLGALREALQPVFASPSTTEPTDQVIPTEQEVDPKLSMAEWKYRVANWDIQLGYREWVERQRTKSVRF